MYKPLGTVASRGGEALETTPYATISVPASREFFCRSREDMAWRRVDLSRIDFTPSAPRRTVTIASPTFAAIDVTADFL